MDLLWQRSTTCPNMYPPSIEIYWREKCPSNENQLEGTSAPPMKINWRGRVPLQWKSIGGDECPSNENCVFLMEGFLGNPPILYWRNSKNWQKLHVPPLQWNQLEGGNEFQNFLKIISFLYYSFPSSVLRWVSIEGRVLKGPSINYLTFFFLGGGNPPPHTRNDYGKIGGGYPPCNDYGDFFGRVLFSVTWGVPPKKRLRSFWTAPSRDYNTQIFWPGNYPKRNRVY